MQHFHKQQFGTRLLALGLSVGLVLGSLTGCGNQEQDTGSSDTLVTSTDSASAGVTNITTFPLPEGPEESTIFVEPVDGISDDFTVVWTLLPCWLWRTAARNIIILMGKNRMFS